MKSEKKVVKKKKQSLKKFDNFFQDIERKWQIVWNGEKIFKAVPKGKKFYCLEMFPYPSGKLHMGHVRNYCIGDCIARFKRMQGFNVLYPIGFDALGLPAENAAIEHGLKPDEWTENNILDMVEHLKALGFSYDWSREIRTYMPEYYKWEQLFFIRMLKTGLAYKKKAPVNYCKKCGTVLANEQVHDGKCWRCSTPIEERELEQWFLKTTAYADELLKELDKLDWPERVKIMQKNWIGKSQGSEIIFPVVDSELNIKVFTTRIDTLYGCTFVAISPEHPFVENLTVKDREKEVKRFLSLVKKKTFREREEKGKSGCFTGSYAVNPVNNTAIPIFIAEYVLADYGTGAIMCVPAHDTHDFEFAEKHKIKVIEVIKPVNEKKAEVFVDDGVLADSDKFSGMTSAKAREEITKSLASKKLASFSINYKLKDWLISRQRYWGCPIPVIYCKKCGIVPVPESELPVTLPRAENVEFGKGNPLLTDDSWLFVRCPVCNSEARRETDTMDTFVDSSWYFLRYCSIHNNKQPFDSETDFWMPVDFYIGGIEHACMHLIYARFFTKVLADLGFINKKLREPFARLVCQGMVLKEGVAMSKSKGNAVSCDDMLVKYGADTIRLFELSAALPTSDIEFSEGGIEGTFRFLLKIYKLFTKVKPEKKIKFIENYILNEKEKLIASVSVEVEELRLNLAISQIFSFFDKYGIYKKYLSDKAVFEIEDALLLLLAPFIPHLAEELWSQRHKNLVSTSKWPAAGKINEEEIKKGLALETLFSDIQKIIKILNKQAAKVYLYCIPKEAEFFSEISQLISEILKLQVQVFSVSDKKKYDPQEKAKKAKPGKPAIYIE